MSLCWVKCKTCNDVKIRHYLLPFAGRVLQARQSSTTRATSGHAGTTSDGDPATVTPSRPRLNANESSKGSLDTISMLTRCVSGLKLAGTARTLELVQIVIVAAAAVAGFAIVIWREAFVQRMVSCGSADGFRKLASLPVAVVE